MKVVKSNVTKGTYKERIKGADNDADEKPAKSEKRTVDVCTFLKREWKDRRLERKG